MTYDEVRLTAGLASDELSDTLLAAPLYANALSLAMGAVTLPTEAPGPGPLKACFDAIALLAENARTTAQQKLYDLAHLYFVYAVAEEVCNSLSTKIPKVKADGKASLTRFSSEATFKDTVARVREIRASLKYSLENINSTASFVPTLCGIINPEVDVVTGE